MEFCLIVEAGNVLLSDQLQQRSRNFVRLVNGDIAAVPVSFSVSRRERRALERWVSVLF
jgi:hypothetical protein